MIALLSAVYPSVAAANTVLFSWNWSDSVVSGLITGSAEFSAAPASPALDLVVVIRNTSAVVPKTTGHTVTGLFFK